MTNVIDIHAAAMRTVAKAAADIVHDLQHLPLELRIAAAGCVVGMLADQLPEHRRASFLEAYTADLLRGPRLDA